MAHRVGFALCEWLGIDPNDAQAIAVRARVERRMRDGRGAVDGVLTFALIVDEVAR